MSAKAGIKYEPSDTEMTMTYDDRERYHRTQKEWVVCLNSISHEGFGVVDVEICQLVEVGRLLNNLRIVHQWQRNVVVQEPCRATHVH
jgi:hypothetical protein